jgi:hypothetical protein
LKGCTAACPLGNHHPVHGPAAMSRKATHLKCGHTAISHCGVAGLLRWVEKLPIASVDIQQFPMAGIKSGPSGDRKILSVPGKGPILARQISLYKSRQMTPRSGFCVWSESPIGAFRATRCPFYSRDSGSLSPSPVCRSTTSRPGPGPSRERLGSGGRFFVLSKFSTSAMPGGHRGQPA